MNKKIADVIEKLKAGEKVINKEGGNSMLPLIKSKQPVTIERPDLTKLEKGDIVYAKVNGRFFTHLISAMKPDEVQISNNHGFVNGWTKKENVFGIITEVDGVEIKNAKAKVLKNE